MAESTPRARAVLACEVGRESSTLTTAATLTALRKTPRAGEPGGRCGQLSAVKQDDEGQEKDLQVKSQRPLAYVVVVPFSAIHQRGRTA